MDDELTIRDTNETPPGGWLFVDMSSGRKFKAEALYDLIRQIVSYRKANDIDPGNPEAEIHAFICSRLPEKCGREAVKIPFQGSYTLEDVKSFANFFKDAVLKYGYASQEVADVRAAVCISCPLNVKIPGCRGCHSIAAFLIESTGGRKTKYANALHECGMCGCSLANKTLMPEELVAQERAKRDYPSYCWMTTEAKTNHGTDET